MRRAMLAVPVALAMAGIAYGGLALYPIAPDPMADGTPGGSLDAASGNARRGAYLARMSGCFGCHSSKKGKTLAGGDALETPFGVFYGPNLTSDPDHGIGAWSLEDFATALRAGVSPQGTPYYPAFPYAFYTRLSDQDVADLYAAFKTVPPVATPDRPHNLKFPFNMRSGLKLWRAVAVDFTRFRPDPDKTAQWNRGAFIVEGPAHCGACHTPRNVFGVRETSRRLEGATGLPGGGSSPAITPSALRANGWSHGDIAYALRIGLMPDGDSFGGTMAEVVREGTRYLSEDDRMAIAAYLLDASPPASAPRQDASGVGDTRPRSGSGDSVQE